MSFHPPTEQILKFSLLLKKKKKKSDAAASSVIDRRGVSKFILTPTLPDFVFRAGSIARFPASPRTDPRKWRKVSPRTPSGDSFTCSAISGRRCCKLRVFSNFLFQNITDNSTVIFQYPTLLKSNKHPFHFRGPKQVQNRTEKEKKPSTTDRRSTNGEAGRQREIDVSGEAKTCVIKRQRRS
ncbi:hypothetical protein CEXT_88491 [Caerostris extrusa]|uniref:Uncharacterized protein n=1 Tax=Caerostris extrusa TaxID=172846 RepID=A0AAV4WR23_CAEEX|nr:hypothetical protein CEXT_88491 [Caerostris extrusa]